MSEFTFFGDMMKALGASIEKDEKKKKKGDSGVPFMMQPPPGVQPQMPQRPQSDLQQDINLGIVDRNVNMPMPEMVAPSIEQPVPDVSVPVYDVRTKEEEAQQLQQTKDNLAVLGLTEGEVPSMIDTPKDVLTQTVTADPIVDQAPFDKERELRARAANFEIELPEDMRGEPPTAEQIGSTIRKGLGRGKDTAVRVGKGLTNVTAGGLENAGNLAVDAAEAVADPTVRFKQGLMGEEATGVEFDDVKLGRVNVVPNPEGYSEIPQYQERLQDPKDGVVNPDGSISTHRMAADVDADGNWVGYPLIVQRPNGTFKEFEDTPEGRKAAIEFNRSIGNVKEFGSDQESAVEWAQGGYKEGTPLEGTTTPVKEVITTGSSEEEVPEPEGKDIPKVEKEPVETDQPVGDQVDNTNKVVTETDDLTLEELQKQVDSGNFSNLGEGQTLEIRDGKFVLVDSNTNQVKEVNDNEKQSFLSKVWDGVKNVVMEQVKDPANQRALFAYAVSRALGYDGATFATQVLSNEWKIKAANAKAEREDAKALKLAEAKKLEKLDDRQFQLYKLFVGDQLKNQSDPEEAKTKFKDRVSKSMVPSTIENVKTLWVGQGNKESDWATGPGKRLAAVMTPAMVGRGIEDLFSMYPVDANFNRGEADAMVLTGLGSFANEVIYNNAKAKDLGAHFERQRISMSATPTVSANFSMVTKEGEEPKPVNLNTWVKASSQVDALTQRLKVATRSDNINKATVWALSEKAYNAAVEKNGGPESEYAKYWENQSAKSLENKGEEASPGMMWLLNVGKQKVGDDKYYAGSYQDTIVLMAGNNK